MTLIRTGRSGSSCRSRPAGRATSCRASWARSSARASGQTVVVDNRGSVGGIIGAEIGAKAPPDGYTLLLAANSLLTINPHVYKKLPYDPAARPAAHHAAHLGGNVVVVHPSVAGEDDQGIHRARQGAAGQDQLRDDRHGQPARHRAFQATWPASRWSPIPYKGTGQAVIDLVAGEVQFFFMNPLVAVPNIKAGKLRALAVTSLTRNTALPDVPTVDESGVPGFKNITWHSVLVPAGTPKPIVKRLNAELVKIVNLPDVKERFKGRGSPSVGSTPGGTARAHQGGVGRVRESGEADRLAAAVNAGR